MKRKSDTIETTDAAIAAFLDAHYSRTHLNDVGPLLGRLASLRHEPAADARVERQWNAAVSLALTGHVSEHGPSHRH